MPEVQDTETVNAFVTIPDLATANAVRGQQGLPALEEPASGWPVVIFQHGITSDKSSAAAIAGTLAVAGYATVAIDHPLHGERGFDVNGDGELDITATGPANATTYMNLSSLLTTRDNLRQSITDLVSLRVSLNNFMAADGEQIDEHIGAQQRHPLEARSERRRQVVHAGPEAVAQVELAPVLAGQVASLARAAHPARRPAI